MRTILATLRALFLSLLVIGPLALADCPDLSLPVEFGVGGVPAGAAIADFDGDRHNDLALAVYDLDAVYIYAGDGSGSYATPASHGVGTGPSAIAVDDFDLDGDLDLAVANSASDNVSILLGDGAGGFGPSAQYAAGDGPAAIATADFNRDGKRDLAVVNGSSDDLSILLGTGAGSFSSAVAYAVDDAPRDVAIGDFDRDGDADLVVANLSSGTISILLGTGTGTFTTALAYQSGGGINAVLAEDFDADGILDVAFVSGGFNSVSILRGDGDGTFTAAGGSGVQFGPTEVVSEDFNDDGKPDLAVLNRNSSSLSVLTGAGDGTFTVEHLPVSTTPTALASGDVDSDGEADVVVLNGTFKTVSILRNTSLCTLNCGTFADAVSHDAGSSPQALAGGDFNRDGDLDLATANSGSDDVSILLGAAGGSFTAGTPVEAGVAPRSVAVADFNADAKPDLVVINSGDDNAGIHLGNGDGTFAGADPYETAPDPQSVATGDFNADGSLDLAVACGSGNVSVLLGVGDGTFAAATHHAAGTHPRFVAVADLDGDGALDLAVANRDSDTVSILLGDGAGGFAAASHVSVGDGPESVAIGDLDEDGILDLIVANGAADTVAVLLGNGDGTFDAPVAHVVGDAPRIIAIGDLNEDAHLDLIVPNEASNQLFVIPGKGDGTFSAALEHDVEDGPVMAIAADADEDGKLDVVTANADSSDVSVLLNTCPPPDLTVTKSHNGDFAQGEEDVSYVITVSNEGTGPTVGAVTITEVPPAGLTVTAMSGTGWVCTLTTLSCTRSDLIDPGVSYPPIVVVADVQINAIASVVNRAEVAGLDLDESDNATTDPTDIELFQDLAINSTHVGSFVRGATGQRYTLTVRNVGPLATGGLVTVTDDLPEGLTATAMSGSGWTCTLATLTCTRSDALAAGAAWPEITLTVDVAVEAPYLVTNAASVSGGGEINTMNNVAADRTVIVRGSNCGAFSAPSGYSTEEFPVALATADFDGDGDPDLAAANANSSTVSVLLGDGDGSFADGGTYDLDETPYAIETGDFNNDAVVDLAVADLTWSSVSILLGEGDGTFAAAQRVLTGSNPKSLVIADFDGDGNSDFATANSGSDDFTVRLGKGDGTFGPHTNYAADTFPTSIATGDFNRDGRADLAVGTINASLVVFIGHGDSTFATGVVHQNFFHEMDQELVVADFDGDGFDDLAAAGESFADVALGNGDGTFQSPVSYEVGTGITGVDVSDVNGDGALDLVLLDAGYKGSPIQIVVLEGNGDGTFETGTTFAVDATPLALAVNDYNGDGLADFAFSVIPANEIRIVMGACPDLAIGKAHQGDFVEGDVGKTYTITVRNVGFLATSGLVTVTDDLPEGLTATSMTGPGWDCLAATRTCTRGDSLEPDATYPDITLTVSVASSAPSTVTNAVSVAGGGDPRLSNNIATDETTIVSVPDLTITKTHAGVFIPGQTGRTYTITVTNEGSVPSSGTVTVADQLPAGLTATAISGSGWACTLGTLTCTHSDALAAGAAHPPITLTVTVNGDAAATVVNRATVSGGGESVTTNNMAEDVTSVLAAPANLVAVASSIAQVQLTWTAVSAATAYEISRSSGNAPFAVIATVGTNGYSDTSVSAGTTYVYRLRASDGISFSPSTANEVATTVAFTDDPLLAGSTKIKAAHITQLRSAVNAVRAAAGLSPAVFTDDLVAGTTRLKAVHITELRSGLDAARSALGLPAIVYTTPTLTTATIAQSAHVADLRAGVK